MLQCSVNLIGIRWVAELFYHNEAIFVRNNALDFGYLVPFDYNELLLIPVQYLVFAW